MGASQRVTNKDGQLYCRRCGLWKDPEDFNPSDKYKARGRERECKDCRSKVESNPRTVKRLNTTALNRLCTL